MKPTSLSIPRHLKSQTAKGLERLMLENNIKRRSWFNYQIVHDGKFFYAWYYADLSDNYSQEILEVSNGSTAS